MPKLKNKRDISKDEEKPAIDTSNSIKYDIPMLDEATKEKIKIRHLKIRQVKKDYANFLNQVKKIKLT